MKARCSLATAGAALLAASALLAACDKPKWRGHDPSASSADTHATHPPASASEAPPDPILALSRRTYSIVVDGDLVHTGSTAGMETWDYAKRDEPKRLAGRMLEGSVQSMTKLPAPSEFLAVATGATGLALIDVGEANKGRVMLVNRHPWSPSDRKGCHSVWRFASGEKGVGYLACGGGGVARLDLSEPAWAEVDARISTEGYVRDVVVLDDASGVSKPSSKTIAAANGMKGLAIVDFSAPKPKLVATTDLGGEARALAVHNGHAFVAAGAAGLVIVDVRKPTEPTVVARLMPKTTDMARGISLSENLALLCLGDSGLVVIDVSDPARPKELGRFDPARALNRVTVRGNEIFAANDADGVAILDLSNPAKPTQVYPKTQ